MNALTLVAFARRAMGVGDLDGADSALRLAARQTPRDPDLLLTKGALQAKRGQLTSAKQSLAHAALLAPERVDCWCALAEVCVELNVYNEAAWALRKCIALDPRMETAHGTRARLLVMRALKRLESAS